MKKYKMLSLDTSSSCTGYALYEAGILSESGSINAEGIDRESKLDSMCREIYRLLDAMDPGTVVIEMTVVERNAMTQRVLSEIVGAVRGWAIRHEAEFVEYRPNIWRKLITGDDPIPKGRTACKEWSKDTVHKMYGNSFGDDECDAILIGQARINEIKNLLCQGTI